MKTTLIIAPHPDDAELAMGGTIAKMLDIGWNVIVVDLTDGEPTPFGSKKMRAKETSQANHVLGIKKRICLDMPNRYLQNTLKNRRKLAEIIRLNQPDLLFGPVMPDWHPDHVAAAELINGARFEAKFCKTKMAGNPHWISLQYGYFSIHRLWYEKPSFIVDVTAYWDKKINAIKAYRSQLKNISMPNHIPFLEKTEIVGRYFGQCSENKYGEPFVGCQPLSIKNLELLID